MIPNVSVQKQDFQSGVVKPSSSGILAIIAPSEKGTLNLPSTFTDPKAAFTQFGNGKLVEDGSIFMNAAGKPCLLIACAASVAATYSAITESASPGTSAITAGATHPLDDLDVEIVFDKGGTIAAAGIVYRYSVDGGDNFSAQIALGTANSIVIPNTGITLQLGAGTIVDHQTATFSTTSAQPNAGDISAALEALRVTKAPWDFVFIDTPATSAMVTQLDTWLTAIENVGVFKGGALNTRQRAHDGTESEAQFATALSGIFSSVSSTRLIVGADHYIAISQSPSFGGDEIDRPVALSVLSRLLTKSEEVDPARVLDGALTNTIIDDDDGNAIWHDEAIYPGLDDLRFTTLRTFQGPDAPQGVFVNNAPLFSPNGSDYVYVQHLRVMNAACSIAYQLLIQRLSIGVSKDPKTGFILEDDAQKIEQYVQGKLKNQLGQKVSGISFTLARNDDLSSNAGATITCTLAVQSLAYIKKFAVTAKFTQ